MLSKEDYLKYLDQMAAIEEHMIEIYSQCSALSDDEELNKEFSGLIKAEQRHAVLVGALKQLFA